MMHGLVIRKADDYVKKAQPVLGLGPDSLLYQFFLWFFGIILEIFQYVPTQLHMTWHRTLLFATTDVKGQTEMPIANVIFNFCWNFKLFSLFTTLAGDCSSSFSSWWETGKPRGRAWVSSLKYALVGHKSENWRRGELKVIKGRAITLFHICSGKKYSISERSMTFWTWERRWREWRELFTWSGLALLLLLQVSSRIGPESKDYWAIWHQDNFPFWHIYSCF